MASAILPTTIPPSRSRSNHPCDPSRRTINFQRNANRVQTFFRIQIQYTFFDTRDRNENVLYPRSTNLIKIDPTRSNEARETLLEDESRFSSVLEKWIATGGKTLRIERIGHAGREKSERRVFGGNWPSRKSLFDSILMTRIVAFAVMPDNGLSLLCRRRIMRVFSPRFPRHRRITAYVQRAATAVGLASLI